MTCPGYEAASWPHGTTSCRRCGRLPEMHPDSGRQPRDLTLEQRLTNLAAQAAGLPDDRGLRAFADHRAWPGGIRHDMDPDLEAAEELADCGSYLVWGMVRDHPGYQAGEPHATGRFERRLRALVRVVQAWHELHTEAH